MSTTDSTWGDTGFGVGDDGFMQVPPKSDTHSSHQEHTDTPTSPGHDDASDAGAMPDAEGPTERLRIEPVSALPPIAPLPPTTRSRRPLLWIGIAALLALVVAVIGVDWYLSSHPSVEEQAFRASEAAPQDVQSGDAEMQSAQESMPVDTLSETALGAVSATTVTTRNVAAPAPEQRSEKPTSTVAPTKPVAAEPTTPVAKEPVTRTTTASAKGPAWVVQVFASPSRDDAEEWLQQLREQRVPDGYIVEQKVKGQSWYRVRFGQYATRDEAEQAAMNRGFRQPWIARVR